MSDLYLMICVDTILAIIIVAFLIDSLIEDTRIDEDIRRAKKIDETLKKIAEVLKKYKESEAEND